MDQLGIHALLMGSYAPVCCGCQMYWRLLAVWLLGSFGLYKEGYLYFVADTVPKRDRWFNLNDVRFLLMGWAGLPVLSAMWSTFSEFVVQCIMLGGFFYTGGFVFLVFPRLEFHQALWHMSVFLAAISHYVAMWNIRMEEWKHRRRDDIHIEQAILVCCILHPVCCSHPVGHRTRPTKHK